MSDFTNHIIQCPSCQHEQECQVYKSINVSLDPSLRKQLIDCKINRFECKKCNYVTRVGTASFIYHDMREKLWLQYFQSEEQSKGSLKMLNTLAKKQGYSVTIYYGFRDLVEAVAKLDS